MKPSFASRYIVFGRVNASDRKSTSGAVRWMSSISHSQNANGLVWGLSTRKIRTPLSIQKRNTPASASHNDRHWVV